MQYHNKSTASAPGCRRKVQSMCLIQQRSAPVQSRTNWTSRLRVTDGCTSKRLQSGLPGASALNVWCGLQMPRHRTPFVEAVSLKRSAQTPMYSTPVLDKIALLLLSLVSLDCAQQDRLKLQVALRFRADDGHVLVVGLVDDSSHGLRRAGGFLAALRGRRHRESKWDARAQASRPLVVKA